MTGKGVSDLEKLQSQLLREKARAEEAEAGRVLAEKKMTLAQDEAARLGREMAELRAQLESLRTSHQPGPEHLASSPSQEELEQARSRLVEQNRDYERLAGRLEEESAAKTMALADAARQRKLVGEQQRKLESLEKEISRLEGLAAELREGKTVVSPDQRRLEEIEKALQGVRLALSQSESKRGELEESYRLARERADTLTSRLEELEKTLRRKDQEFDTLASSLMHAQERARQLETELPLSSGMEEELREQLASARTQTEDLRRQLAERQHEFDQLQKELQTSQLVKTALAERDTRIRSLEEKLEAYREARDKPAPEDPVARAQALEAELQVKDRQIGRLEQTIRRLSSPQL